MLKYSNKDNLYLSQSANYHWGEKCTVEEQIKTLTLEQNRLGLHRSTYSWIFSNKYIRKKFLEIKML